MTLEIEPRPRPRYGYGRPAHPLLEAMLDARRSAFADALRSVLAYRDALARIPLDATSPSDPSWHNGWFQGLDAAVLYATLARHRPALLVEVGSGNSTKFARRAITDESLPTRLVSIDPQPRAEVDALCDEVVRERLEDVDPSVLDRLQPGDVLFVDSSHYCLQNSDVTVLFTEVLPRLPGGVLVHLHDIFLPWDYPPQMAGRHYSEQYLLATLLLSGQPRFEVVLANFYVCLHPDLHSILAPLWADLLWAGTPLNGLSFWLRTV